MMNPKTSHQIFLFLFVLLLTHSSLYSQSIYLKVKKGSVVHNSKTVLPSSPAFQMKSTDNLTVVQGSIIIASSGDKFVEIPSGKKYSYDDIKKLTTLNSSWIPIVSEIFKNTMQVTRNNYGSSTRGAENEPDFYSPKDTFVVLDEKFILEIGNQRTKLKSNIKVINSTSKKVVYDNNPKYLEVELTKLPASNYIWSYDIEFEKKDSIFVRNYENTFIIPTAKNKTIILKDYNNYKNQLLENKKNNLISDDFYQILLEEYKAEKKIYTNQ